MPEKIICNNCGLKGHIYRECKNPVSSFGVIIFRLDLDIPKILMIQRRNSLCYIEFLRGKYDINNLDYIRNLIEKFSIEERDKINSDRFDSFDSLWADLWSLNNTDVSIKSYLKKDYDNGKYKFNKIKSIIFNLLKEVNVAYETTEWEFPKGRRNKNETNEHTAKREFREETGYLDNDYTLINNILPIREEYRSNNNIRYRNTYNVGYLVNHEKIPVVCEDNELQVTEISDIKWLSKNEALDKIRDYHVYRKSIIMGIFELIDNLTNNYLELK